MLLHRSHRKAGYCRIGNLGKAFPIPLKNTYVCSVGWLLFKLMLLLSSLTNKVTHGIAPVYNYSEIHSAKPHIQKINEFFFFSLLLKAEKSII